MQFGYRPEGNAESEKDEAHRQAHVEACRLEHGMYGGLRGWAGRDQRRRGRQEPTFLARAPKSPHPWSRPFSSAPARELRRGERANGTPRRYGDTGGLRRGYSVGTRIAATPRPRRGYSVGTRVAATPRPRRGRWRSSARATRTARVAARARTARVAAREPARRRDARRAARSCRAHSGVFRRRRQHFSPRNLRPSVCVCQTACVCRTAHYLTQRSATTVSRRAFSKFSPKKQALKQTAKTAPNL